MKERRTFGRSLRWTSAVAVTVLLHLALYWGVALTRDSEQKLRRQQRQFAEIQYFDADTADRSEALRQQMSLFDPRPLLLPTQWNASNASGLLAFWQEEADIFPEFAPMFELEDGNYVDDFGNVPATYDRLSAAQTEFASLPFRELGRSATLGLAYEEELGMSVSVVDLATGAELKRILIYNEEVQALDVAWPDRRPATLLATVEDSFQVGGLSVVSSSGFNEADREINTIAYANFSRLGQLEDGVYLLEIVP